MNRQPVVSSNIRSVGHDPATNTMHVEFNNGGVYEYEGVTTEKHAALMKSGSIGSHLHQHIKPHHNAKKL